MTPAEVKLLRAVPSDEDTAKDCNASGWVVRIVWAAGATGKERESIQNTALDILDDLHERGLLEAGEALTGRVFWLSEAGKAALKEEVV